MKTDRNQGKHLKIYQSLDLVDVYRVDKKYTAPSYVWILDKWQIIFQYKYIPNIQYNV